MSRDDRRARGTEGAGHGAPHAPSADGSVGGDDTRVRRSPASASRNRRADDLRGGAAQLAAFVAAEIGPPASLAGTAERGVRILLASRAREARRKRVRAAAGAGLAFAAAGFVAWTAIDRPAPALSYTVNGATPPREGFVRSSAEEQPELAFSDGTNIRVLSSTRARVRDVGRRGARFVLEDGRAHVQVAHRPGADWQVQAGTFVIRVHGTAFLVAWNASQSRLDVQMESGVVAVDGPRSGDTLMLRAGEALSVRSDGSRAVTRVPRTLALRAPSSAGWEGGPAPVPVMPRSSPQTPDGPHTVAPIRAPAPRSAHIAVPQAAPPELPWSERLADGEAAAIVAEAQRRGMAAVLAEASSEDLAALADAARFRKQDQLARRVLLAQRRRFPGTVRAEEASFLLGRLAEGPGGRASDALAWYERYLREAPAGAYAAEAMGRMMLVLERQQRTEEARALAAAYLRKFPHGAYARAARRVASSSIGE